MREVTTPLDMPLLEELSVHMYDVTDFIPLSNAALPRLKSLEFQNAHGPLYASGFGIRGRAYGCMYSHQKVFLRFWTGLMPYEVWQC